MFFKIPMQTPVLKFLLTDLTAVHQKKYLLLDELLYRSFGYHFN
jgi:hypothetical protein